MKSKKKSKKETQQTNPPLPNRKQLLQFIQDSDAPVGRREIARAFKIKGSDRAWLRRELNQLKDEGLIGGDRRRATPPGHLPPVTVIEVARIDSDGDVICHPAEREGDGKPPMIYLLPVRGFKAEPGLGDRVLARLKKVGDGVYEARPIKLLERAPQEVLGLLRETSHGAVLMPVDRRNRHDYEIAKEDIGEASDGDYVVARGLGGFGRRAAVTERLGKRGDPRITSLLVLKSSDVPMTFDPEATALADSKDIPPLGKRTDLRDLALVTIDGADARDYDDAVWAEPDSDPENKGGWHLRVAIADVSHYVRIDDALDRTARERGNSVYCPDRVVPMLPEALSNGVCSLRPDEDRACLVAEMWIDQDGRLKRHRFQRALMRSIARLTYEQVQQARDGNPDDVTSPLTETVIAPLYGAFAALDKARRKRRTLELDVPERRIVFDEDGHVAAIKLAERLDSHRLIEEFMITANVAAAETLEKKKHPVMYRIHEPPAAEKLEALGQALDGLDLPFNKSGKVTPALFAGVLDRVSGSELAPLVSEMILRSQSQAVYGPARLGHFGLALKSYCHFTSPIRRYADILVHRALIHALKLGDDGLSPDDGADFDEIGEAISNTERRAMKVEREVKDRLIVAFVADRVGAVFDAQISGVTKHGLFIRLNDTGAEGLLPMRTLPDDWYIVDDAGFSMTGERHGLRFRLGEQLSVELADADTLTGSLSFRLIDGGTRVKTRERPKPSQRHRRGRR